MEKEQIIASDKVKKIIEAIQERTRTTAYKLIIQKDSKPDLFDSKFGGVPYWDKAMEYPADSEGEKLMLLAQINFDRAEVDERLPQQGILQFFIANDEIYGVDFDEQDIQEGFRVVYHEKPDYTMTRDQVLAMDIPLCTDAPVFKEVAVDIVANEVYMGDNDLRFSEIFREVVKELFGEDIEGECVWDYLDDEVYDFNYPYDELKNDGHHMLGYPYFTQGDPRSSVDYYDTVLLQIDSDMIGQERYVLWGDFGVANFFINSKALKKKDFSKVLYNWACG